MTHDDWIGLGTSVGAHAALLLLFALWSAGRPETPVPGAVQVEIGAFAEGRPVQQATAPASAPASEQDATQDAPESAPSETSEPAPADQEQAAPVDLPEQQEAPPGDDPPPEDPPDEQDAAPAPTASTPDSAVASAGAPAAPDSAATDTSRAAGAEEAASATGAATGEEGEGDDEEKAAPFDIEGLDRTRLHGRLPQYTEKVNATIKVEITVGPQGRVVGQRLLQKANPSLERSVVEALRQWRFDRLPSEAPQENQTGVVTFRFRLE